VAISSIVFPSLPQTKREKKEKRIVCMLMHSLWTELRVHEDIERGDNETIKLKTKLAGRTAKIDKSA